MLMMLMPSEVPEFKESPYILWLKRGNLGQASERVDIIVNSENSDLPKVLDFLLVLISIRRAIQKVCCNLS